MSDAPIQTILQQRDARPVSGEHLEVLGKKAASEWVTGKVASLHEAIVETVRHERLSPEQVRRVVEFTNGDAYLQEFRKEGSHKVVHFDCGPADPAQVLQDLNDGGGGSVYDRGTLDYSRDAKTASAKSHREQVVDFYMGRGGTPTGPSDRQRVHAHYGAIEKQASAAEVSPYEAGLDALFGQGGQTMPYADNLQPLTEAHTKLAAARDFALAELGQLELDYAAACDQLFTVVKQAALSDTALSTIVAAWGQVNPSPEYIKLAFEALTDRLQENGVFRSGDEIGASLMKQAAAGVVNCAHPLVTSYVDFYETLSKLAHVREAHTELDTLAGQAELAIKQAAGGGALGAAKKGVQAVSQGIDSASPALAQFLVGAKDAPKLAPGLAKGLKATTAVGGALAANAGLQSITDRPMVRSGLNAGASIVPGTQQYQERRYRTMTGQ